MKTRKLLSVILALVMVVSVLTITSSAHSTEDWEIVGESKDTAKLTKVGASMILESAGWYPIDNAGLLYKNALDLSSGIELNVTLTCPPPTDSSDAWHGIFLLSAPTYFDTGARAPEDGLGIVLLCRYRNDDTVFEWVELSESGFSVVTSEYAIDYSETKDYYTPGTDVTYKVIIEDDELCVYVDGVKVEHDFSSLLEYFTDNKAYIGYSMSCTNRSQQIFSINYLNGEQAAASGEVTTKTPSTVETEAPIDFENISEFKMYDFTNEDTINVLTGANSIKYEFDSEKECLKITADGTDPYVYFKVPKTKYFPGDKFTVCKIEMMTEFEGTGEFFFVAKEAPDIGANNIQVDIEASTEFAVQEFDMDYSGNWASEIQQFRFDPIAGDAAGEVFYIKSISFAEYVPPATTTRDPSLTTEAPETDAATNAPETDAATKAPGTKAPETEAPKSGEKSNGWVIWVIIGAVAVAAVVVVVIVIAKKKK